MSVGNIAVSDDAANFGVSKLVKMDVTRDTLLFRGLFVCFFGCFGLPDT